MGGRLPARPAPLPPASRAPDAADRGSASGSAMPTSRKSGCLASVGKNLFYAGAGSSSGAQASKLEMLVGTSIDTRAPTSAPTGALRHRPSAAEAKRCLARTGACLPGRPARCVALQRTLAVLKGPRTKLLLGLPGYCCAEYSRGTAGCRRARCCYGRGGAAHVPRVCRCHVRVW